MPVVDRYLAGDDGRTALMAVIDDLEEITTLLAGERDEPPIVEDEELDARERLEQASIASVAAGEREVGEQLGKALVEDGSIVATGFVAESCTRARGKNWGGW